MLLTIYLKLSNNCLSDVADIKTVAGELFENADDIAWLDLSFNELAKVDDVSILCIIIHIVVI